MARHRFRHLFIWK